MPDPAFHDTYGSLRPFPAKINLLRQNYLAAAAQETVEEQDWMDPGPDHGTQGGPPASEGPPSRQGNLRGGIENDSRDQRSRGQF